MRRTIALTALAVAVAAAVPTAAAALTGFRSPSRNISCYLDGGTARCDIKDKTWKAPKPKGCRLDWGQGLTVASSGSRGRVVCAGDTALSTTAPILAYGRSITRQRTTCSSSTNGMTCRNRRGHGFQISRTSYRLF